MAKKTKKRLKTVMIILILLIILVLLVAIPVVALYVQYRNLTYTHMDPVERPDEYVMPDYPDIIFDNDAPHETQLPDPPLVETSAETDAIESLPETDKPEISVSETVSPETDSISSQPETQAPVVETEPPASPETLPSVVFTPPDSSSSGQQPENKPANPGPAYNPNNSFANTANAISVYGRTPIYKVNQINRDVLNILLMGTDSRDVALDRGRSDTMIVVSYNKRTGEIKMVSFLRDSLVPLEGYDWNRLNAAYAFDGVGLTINTINQLFGLDIQHFVVVDFNGAKNFIDQVGGIDLQLTEGEAQFIGISYSEGLTHLNGAQALTHMRNRSIGNDFGRTQRQREVITAVFTKILNEKSLPEILEILQNAMRMVKTNIPASTLTSLAASIVGNSGNISVQLQNVPYSDAYQFGWYNGLDIIFFDIKSTAARVLDFLY